MFEVDFKKVEKKIVDIFFLVDQIDIANPL